MFDLIKNGITPILPENFCDLDFHVVEGRLGTYIEDRGTNYNKGDYSWCEFPRRILKKVVVNNVQYTVLELSKGKGFLAIDLTSFATVTETVIPDGIAAMLGLKSGS